MAALTDSNVRTLPQFDDIHLTDESLMAATTPSGVGGKTSVAQLRNAIYAQVTQTNVNAPIRPNVLNVWAEPISEEFEPTYLPGDSGAMEEYMLEFTAGENLSLVLPDGARWSEEPEFESGYTYHVSILNGLALYAGFPND